MLVKLLRLLSLAAAIRSTMADQASNFPVSPELAARYGCGEACQSMLNQTSAKDLQIFDTPFDYDFYETAANFSTAKIGDLLKLSPVNYTILSVPAGIATYKIQYVSADLDGSPVPATAFVAVPFARRCSPFKLVAYAHGTTGMFRGCAPSSSSFLFDYQSWSPLLLAGYAIVATDYAGLGNNHTAHKYISSKANANDVYWSVIAAKTAFPGRFSDDWVSIGHSQGGGASWKLSEHPLVQDRNSGYLGGVAIAPGTYLYDALKEAAAVLIDDPPEDLGKYGVFMLLPSMAFALRAVFPGYTPPFFTDLLKQRIALAEVAQLCDTAVSGLVLDTDFSQLIDMSQIGNLERIEEFQKINSAAQGDSAPRPLLVIQGANDSITSANMTVKAYENSCKAGNEVHLSLYPDLDHSAVVGASAPEWLAFIARLFEEEKTFTSFELRGAKCTQETILPFDSDNARKSSDTDLIDGWAT